MSSAGRSARWAGICAVSGEAGKRTKAATPRKPARAWRVFEEGLKVGFSLSISIRMAVIIVSQPILSQVFARLRLRPDSGLNYRLKHGGILCRGRGLNQFQGNGRHPFDGARVCPGARPLPGTEQAPNGAELHH